MKLKGISNKKVRKWDQKQNNNKNGIISLQYKHNFKVRLKNTLNNKTQESRISHAWLAIHWLPKCNFNKVAKQLY